MGGKDCQEEICAPDKEEQMMKEAMEKRASGPRLDADVESIVKPMLLGSRRRQVLSNDKPLNAVILGRVTWPLLHRMTLMYPQ